jgi:methylthioribose-1-phosphate isomerase
MKVGEREYRSIWQDGDKASTIMVIDQRRLPFSFDLMELRSVDDVCMAISTMAVRGAPLIGAAAAWGIWLSFLEHRNEKDISGFVLNDAVRLKTTRPTAVNLAWAVDRMIKVFESRPAADALQTEAAAICDTEAENSRRIGMNGLALIEEISLKKNGSTVNILTHCNAGWLACVDFGTALAPVYLAHDSGISVHVWVDETRPRNQGSRLTAWELSNHGVPCTVITDNAGGHLMQNGMVDIVIVGCDRATANGDVANKIGTYLKALAAHDNGIPFYSAFPVSSFDLTIERPEQIPVEERDEDEVRMVEGTYICQKDIPVSNYAFDITPARLITGIITDRGICRADKESIMKLFS